MPGRKCVNCQLIKPGVKLCADDLLCPECSNENDRILRELHEQRKNNAVGLLSEPLAADAAVPTDVPAEATTKSRAAKTKQSKKIQQEDNLYPPIAAAAVANSWHTSTSHVACCNCQKECLALNDRIDHLATTVAQQQQIILNLTNRLNLVLSFLDIQNSSIPAPETDVNATQISDGAMAAPHFRRLP